MFANTITPSNLKQDSRNNNNNKPRMTISWGANRIRTSSEACNNENTKPSYCPPNTTMPRNTIDSYDKETHDSIGNFTFNANIIENTTI